ncbi:MAG: hypothetical protein Q8K43_10785 [Sulfurimicrobium sp.]|nr:hypothetical protein [Sulfurimicrobium sp.]
MSTVLASMTGQSTGDSVGVSLLRKAMQNEAQTAQQQQVNTVSQPAKTTNNLPANLGQNINTTA